MSFNHTLLKLHLPKHFVLETIHVQQFITKNTPSQVYGAQQGSVDICFVKSVPSVYKPYVQICDPSTQIVDLRFFEYVGTVYNRSNLSPRIRNPYTQFCKLWARIKKLKFY